MYRFAFRNGPFRILKRSVLASEMDRFRTPNGMYCYVLVTEVLTRVDWLVFCFEIFLHISRCSNRAFRVIRASDNQNRNLCFNKKVMKLGNGFGTRACII